MCQHLEMLDLKCVSSVSFCLISATFGGNWLGCSKLSKIIKIDFWRLYGVYFGMTKKMNFFSAFLHMPTKSMRISRRFFSFSRNLKNLKPSSDFKMNQIFEILSEFTYSEVWWSWNSTLSKEFEKLRFSTFWTPDLLQKPLSPIKISAAISRKSCGNFDER